MTEDTRLQRSRDALLGGVCAGLAEHFDVDPVIVRILAVVLAIGTAGVGALVYVVLWMILPLAPKEMGPVEVAPQSVHSDTYGEVKYQPTPLRADEAARAAAEVASVQQARVAQPYVGVGHVPPEPPAAAWAQGRPGSWQTPPPGWQQPGWQVPNWQAPPVAGVAPQSPYAQQPGTGAGVPPVPPVAPAPVAPASVSPAVSVPPVPPVAPVAPAPAPVAPVAPSAAERRDGAVTAGIWVGSFLLFVGVGMLLGKNIDGVSWWQFWPLVLAVVGIVQMVVPGAPGHRTDRFVAGLTLFCLGGTLLPMSLGVTAWATLITMVVHLWPLLLVMAGFSLIGAVTHSPVWKLASGACFVMFCIVGLAWYSVPGAVDSLVLVLPYGREFVLPFAITIAAAL